MHAVIGSHGLAKPSLWSQAVMIPPGWTLPYLTQSRTSVAKSVSPSRDARFFSDRPEPEGDDSDSFKCTQGSGAGTRRTKMKYIYCASITTVLYSTATLGVVFVKFSHDFQTRLEEDQRVQGSGEINVNQETQ
jgi:hypothetical protein